MLQSPYIFNDPAYKLGLCNFWLGTLNIYRMQKDQVNLSWNYYNGKIAYQGTPDMYHGSVKILEY